MSNPLHKWVISNGYFAKKGSGKPTTHLLLNGGIWSIPDHARDEFTKRYAKDLKKHRHYLCETKSNPYYKFFMDLDFMEEEEITEEQVRKYMKTIMSVIKDFFDRGEEVSIYEAHEMKAIVCMTDTKSLNGLIKTGVHVIFPGIVVEKDLAVYIRNACIQKLVRQYGPRHASNSWADVVDKTVYEQNGLRMIGSYKCSRCKVCRNNKEKMANCEECMTKGVVDEGRAYYPRFIVDTDGNEYSEIVTDYLENGHEGYYRMMKDTSVVLSGEDLEELPYEWNVEDFPTWFDFNENMDKEKKTSKARQIRRAKAKMYNYEDDRKGKADLGVKNKVRLDHDDPRFIKIWDFINNKNKNSSNMPIIFRDLVVLEVYFCITFYLVATDCRRCMNLLDTHNNGTGEHLSNTIWFYIDKQNVYQKCFCRKESLEERKYGLCAEYRSAPYPMPATMKKLLFPDKGKNVEYVEQRTADEKYMEELDELLLELEAGILEKAKYEQGIGHTDRLKKGNKKKKDTGISEQEIKDITENHKNTIAKLDAAHHAPPRLVIEKDDNGYFAIFSAKTATVEEAYNWAKEENINAEMATDHSSLEIEASGLRAMRKIEKELNGRWNITTTWS